MSATASAPVQPGRQLADRAASRRCAQNAGSGAVVFTGRLRTMALAMRRARGSSPKLRMMSASSRSGHSLTSWRAVTPWDASKRMSSAASRWKLKPLASVSSWREDNPKSISAPSAS